MEVMWESLTVSADHGARGEQGGRDGRLEAEHDDWRDESLPRRKQATSKLFGWDVQRARE